MSTSFYGGHFFAEEPLPGKKKSAARFSAQKAADKAFASSEINIADQGNKTYEITMKEDQEETYEIDMFQEKNAKKSRTSDINMNEVSHTSLNF